MNKKKLAITITALCLVVVAVVAAVVGVLAATQQAVTSKISVGYTANNVKATITLNHTFGRWTPETTDNTLRSITTGFQQSNDATVTFLPAETTTVGTLNMNKVDLGAASDGTYFNRFVIFKYTFKNDYATGNGTPITVATTYNPTVEATGKNATLENVEVFFASTKNDAAMPGVDLGDMETSSTTFPDATVTNSIGTGWAATAPSTITLNQQETCNIYVLVAVKDVDQGSNFEFLAGENIATPALKFDLNKVTV